MVRQQQDFYEDGDLICDLQPKDFVSFFKNPTTVLVFDTNLKFSQRWTTKQTYGLALG